MPQIIDGLDLGYHSKESDYILILTKEDCVVLAEELTRYGCFNEERREQFNAIMKQVHKMASGVIE